MSHASEADAKPALLLVSRKWPPAVGGMETYSVELSATLQELYDVHELVLPGRPDGRPPGLGQYAAFVAKALGFMVVRGWRFPRLVLTDPVMFPAAVAHWILLPRGRRIVVVHGLDLVYHLRPGFLSRIYGSFLNAFRLSQGIFTKVVANSRNTARLANEIGISNTAVINPSLPAGALARAGAPVPTLPSQWPAKGRTILYFGRLVPRKGALWFAQHVLPRVPDAIFVVAGQAPDPKYRAALDRCDRVMCLGRVESTHLAAMIRAADVVVMPNIETPDAIDVEGFGLAAVETSALGGRLLASRIDGLTDAVKDGETGTLVTPGDVEAWQRAATLALDASSRGSGDPDAISRQTQSLFSRSRQLAAFERILSG